MGAGVTTSVAEHQERRLRCAAEESGSVADLLYFYAVQGNREAIDALRERAMASPEDRVVHSLVTGASCDVLKAEAEGTHDPWVLYSVAKALLRENRLEDAYDVMEAGLRQGRGDVSTINLLIRFLASVGAPEMVTDLIGVSLELSPDQYDLVALRDDLRAGRSRRYPLYLEPLPRRFSVAFYLPVYNVERFIRRALEGIFAMNYPLEAVYVVDDGTPDDSIRVAEAFPVTVLRHDHNRGLAAARNTAFQHADADCLGAIDTDAYPDPGYAKYATMELENAAPEVAGVGGRLQELHTDTPADLWRALHLSQDPGPVRIHPPRFLYGSNTLYDRKRVIAVGGYNERYRTNSEDGDIARKLLGAGYTFTVTPHAKAFHMRRDSVDSALRTLWGWAQAHREELGILNSLDAALEEMPTILNQAVSLINDDMGDTARHPAAYLDFLYLFHCTSQNLLSCHSRDLVGAGAVRYVQDTMLDSLAELDARHGGALGGRVRADIGPMLMKATPEPLAAEQAAAFEAFMAELRKVYAAIEPRAYTILEG